MFRRFNYDESDRQSHGRGGRGGHGRKHGRGRRMHGGGPRSFREGCRRGGQNPAQAGAPRADARPANIPGMGEAEAVCPLCENHCPLSAPSCKQGRAYAASARNR